MANLYNINLQHFLSSKGAVIEIFICEILKNPFDIPMHSKNLWIYDYLWEEPYVFALRDLLNDISMPLLDDLIVNQVLSIFV